MDPKVRDLFARFLDTHPEAERTQFEGWVAAHVEHEEALRGFMTELEMLRDMLDLSQESIAAHLLESHGIDLDHSVSLDLRRPPTDHTPGTGPGTIDLTPHLPAREGSSRRYRVRRELARGGMGTILEVWDQDLRRRVAMKVTRQGAPGLRVSDSRALARFLEEAQITGQLDHPGVVPVHELGVDASGEVFFTMRLVRGNDLETVLREMDSGERDWSLTRVLGVVQRVCEAVAFAHSKGVIHRDLKPSNVMVGRFGEVYVMDWGLAKVLGRPDVTAICDPEASGSLARVESLRGDLEDDESSDSPVFTQFGEVVGTPAYMPPEQARGDLDQLGPPADVYSVGAILYRILAGKRPYDNGRRQSAGEVMIAVASGPPEPLARSSRPAPAELCAICDKAMSRAVADRYGNMQEMAEDLRRYLEGRVVQAYGHGPILELRKWIERNRVLAGVAIVSVVAILGISLRSALVQAASNRELRQTQLQLTSLLADDLVGRDPAAALAVALRMPRGEDDFPVRTAILGAMQRLQEQRFLEGFGVQTVSNDADEVLGWHETSRTVRAWDLRARDFVREYPAPQDHEGLRVFADPSGRYAVVFGSVGAWLLPLDSGTWLPLQDGGATSRASSIAFLPNAERFLVGRSDGSLQLWDDQGVHCGTYSAHAGAVTHLEVHPTLGLAVSGSGTTDLSLHTDHAVRVWSLAQQGASATLTAGPVFEMDEEPTSIALHPADALAYVGDLGGRLRCFDLTSGEALDRDQAVGGMVWSIDVHPSGELFAVGSAEGVQVFETGGVAVPMPGFPHGSRGVSSVAFDTSGQRLLTIGFDLSAQTWNLEQRFRRWQVSRSIPARGHRSFADNGRWLGSHERFLTTTADGTHIWFARTNPHLPRILPQSSGRDPVRCLAFGRAGTQVFIGRDGHGVDVVRFDPGVEVVVERVLRPPAPGATPLLLHAGKELLLIVWSSGHLQREPLDPEGPTPSMIELGFEVELTQLGAGDELLLCAGERQVACLDFEAGLGATPIRSDVMAEERVSTLAIHPRGTWTAIGTWNGRIVAFPRGSQTRVPFRPVPPETREQTRVFGLAFHPTKPVLASSGPDGILRFWSLEGGSLPFAQSERQQTHGALAYLEGGSELIVQSQSGGTLWNYDAETLQRRVLGGTRSHSNSVSCWAFDADNSHLLTASKDQTSIWWDLAAGKPLLVFRGHPAPVTCAAISADGARAATGDEGGTVRVWPLDPIEAGRQAMPYDPHQGHIDEILPKGFDEE